MAVPSAPLRPHRALGGAQALTDGHGASLSSLVAKWRPCLRDPHAGVGLTGQTSPPSRATILDIGFAPAATNADRATCCPVVSPRSCQVGLVSEEAHLETPGFCVSMLCVGWLFSPFSPCWWPSLRCFVWTFVQICFMFLFSFFGPLFFLQKIK